MFPSAATIRAWRGVLHTLIGFENDYEDGGDGYFFNFILSNGTRSTQRDDRWPTDYTLMIPKGALKKIRRVTIHYWANDYIDGVSFFDKDGALLWKIGYTGVSYQKETETVVLAENEVIVGVVAKLRSGYQSVYTDFQFQIATK